ncbi:unnamed protein product [Moneuplotes crassus]|uniref:Uncharacterized protein n=1 Tax=Euplotes crassus TaxID=5936 RepID=A0AAD2D9C4_EUPCR|nr:unnamed protein product [Moneuplotes crassus]
MDSKSNKTIVDDKVIKNLFADHSGKSSGNCLSDCKYFDLLPSEAQQSSKKDTPTEKLLKKEWMETLSIEQRMLAISTIFTKNYDIENRIRDELVQISIHNSDHEASQYRDRFHHFSNSNEDFLGIAENGPSRINGYNSHISFATSCSVGNSAIFEHISFIDTHFPEDTLSFHSDLVENVDVFFDLLEENTRVCFKEQDSRSFGSSPSLEGIQWYQKRPDKIESRLKAKIWCLIEVALDKTYQRSCGKKKSKSPKNMIKPVDANFYIDKEQIVENLDLVNIITPFISDESNDRKIAIDFLKKNPVKREGRKELIKVTSTPYSHKKLDPEDYEVIEQWEAVVSSFRTYLEEKISDDRLAGNETQQNNEELHEILYKLKLYNYDEKIDEDIRCFASYYYNDLAHQGREKALDMLCFESSIDHAPKDPKKTSKNKKNKEKSKRRNNKKDKKNQLKKKEETKNQVTEEPETDDQFEKLEVKVSGNNKLGKAFLNEIDTSIQNKQDEDIEEEKEIPQQDLQEEKSKTPESSTKDNIPDSRSIKFKNCIFSEELIIPFKPSNLGAIEPNDQKEASEV